MANSRSTAVVSAISAVAVALIILGTVGRPLIGSTVFHGSDLLLGTQPARESRPPDFSWHYGPLGDTVDSTMPNRQEFAERARSGHIAWWNPYVSGGAPLVTTSASGTASPFIIPFVLFPSDYAIGLAKVLEMVVAAGFTFLFLRRLGTGRALGLLGGAIYMTSGFAISWTNWQHPQVAALVPAVFWATERCIQLRTLRSAIPVALAVGGLLVGGFPAVAAWAMALLAAYVIVRLAAEELSIQTIRRGAIVAVGGLLGVALVAVIVMPLASHLSTLALDWRQQSPENVLDLAHLATAVVPDVLGNYTDRNYFGPTNAIEGFSFLGAVTVSLVLVGVVLRPPEHCPRGVRAFFVAALALLVVLTYFGGPLLEAAQRLPVFDTNFVGRLRSLIGFTAAVVAALGAQAAAERRLPRTWWAWSIGGVVAAAMAGVIIVALGNAVELADLSGESRYVTQRAVLPAFVVLGTIVVVGLLLAPLRSRRWRLLVVVLPCLFALEALVVVVPRFPTSEESDFYAESATHEFLLEHIDGERLATVSGGMMSGTPTFFGLRSATGHVHHQTTWGEMLRTADPSAFHSPTWSTLSHAEDIARSPLLDRMAVRYVVTDAAAPIWGTHLAPSTSDGTVLLDGTLTVEVPAQPIRGVEVVLAEPLQPPSDGTTLGVEIAAKDGTVVTASRRFFGEPNEGPVTIAVPGEGLPTSGTMTISVSAEGSAGPPRLVAAPTGGPAIGLITPDDDGLRLVFVDGSAVWERQTALPRFRWASEVLLEPDAQARLAALATGVDSNSVVLEADSGPAEGAAEVSVRRDDPERIDIDVDAEGSGFLVVADAIQTGWTASVDGASVELLPADHGVVAVAVPAGSHQVSLRYDPVGRSAGLAITIIAIVLLTAIALAPILHRRLRWEP
ncbi:MAG: YfhO family protein [Hyphomicrobiales bacterium]|nr:YfhO family protein [Hyphomicrobiales bacterium]